MFPRKFRRDRKLLSAKNVERAFRASTISCRITTNFARLTFFSYQENTYGYRNTFTLSLSSLVSRILFSFLDSGLFGWDSLPSAILENILRGHTIAHVALRTPLSKWTAFILPLSSLSQIRMKKHLFSCNHLARSHHIFCQSSPMPNNSFSQTKIWYQIQSNPAWGSGRVISGSGIWPKYGTRFGKRKIYWRETPCVCCATQTARFTKIWAQDEGCLSGIREIMTTQIHVLAANAIQQG